MEHDLASDPLVTFAGTGEELDEYITRDAAGSRPGEYSTSAARRQFAVGADGLMRWRRPASQLIAMQRAFNVPLSPDLYEQVSCPVQLIGAERGGEGRPERLGPWPFGRGAVARVQARYRSLDAIWLPCGHMVPGEMPDELAALILEFCRVD